MHSIISVFRYDFLRVISIHVFILILALQLGSCEPNKKKSLTSISHLKLGDLRMKVTPTELVGDQKDISVKFTPFNEQILYLEQYNLTIQVEDRAGVINWDSKIHTSNSRNSIKVEHTPLTSFSFLKELNTPNNNYNTFSIDLQLAPDMGSRQIVIKFKLYNHQNRLLQEAAATWRIKPDEPTPDPEDPIDPTAVTRRKPNPTSEEKALEKEILEEEREQAAKKEEEERIEQEIRKKCGEEWLNGEGEKWWREQEEIWKRMREEKAKEDARQQA
jgi:hypothetical protein